MHVSAVLHYPSGQTFIAVIISPHPPNIGDPDTPSDHFFIPSIILWRPYITHSSIFPKQSILCPLCELPTQHSHWNDGSTSSTQPRLIHDLDNMVYLVSAVYTCKKKHKLLTHDEVILTRFPTPTLIPLYY